MTPRQCEIAAESYSASLLARAGYDVLVQYGANQPHYDLVANKGREFLPISVKGSQNGGWTLAVGYIKPGVSYHQAIDLWLTNQRQDVVFFFVQFLDVGINDCPRVYVAKPSEVAKQLKLQCAGRGHGALHENYQKNHPKSKYDHAIPESWRINLPLLETMGISL